MARILIVDDEAAFRDLYRQVLSEAGFETLEAGSAEEALELIRSTGPAMVISDVRMPGEDGIALLRQVRQEQGNLPFLLVTAYADVQGAVEALKLGAVDYLAKPVDLDELVAAVRDALGVRNPTHSWDLPAEATQGMVVESPLMQLAVRDAYRVARSNATVLLTGESGTGKEVMAGFIHRQSERRDGPLVAVNCAAISPQLLHSELFGHEKGAFTGAINRRLGRFREANGGTLFLDEVGEMPLELQPVLLRVLETRRLTAVGGDRELSIDVRLVAATNRDLEKEVEAGRFRSDLYYRLNVIALMLPPLRERTEDILALARFFLARNGSGEKRLSPAAAQCLMAHPWPGNVREMANAMERASLLSRANIILPEHLPPNLRSQPATASEVPGAPPSGHEEQPAADMASATDSAGPDGDVATLEEGEIQLIRRALVQTEGNRTRAAELLGISRRGLINKIKRYGL